MSDVLWSVLIILLIGGIIIYAVRRRAKTRATAQYAASMKEIHARSATDIEYVINGNIVAFSAESPQGTNFLGADTKEIPLAEADDFRKSAEKANLIVRQSGIYD